MDWYALGHAMWLADVSGLRVLFDPVLTPSHHGDVFVHAPARTVDPRALRPDFIVVTHAHRDHFDVPSLRCLARLDPDTVVITSDPLVEQSARALGFRTVHRAAVYEIIQIGTGRLITTPSYADVTEWGVIVDDGRHAVWNQVDTLHRNADDVRTTLDRIARGLSRESIEPDLLLARWQPMLEIAAQFGHRTTFPAREYTSILDQIAATRARAVVPASAGERHLEPFAWVDSFLHPVSETRFLRDVSRRAPAMHALPCAVGGRYTLHDGHTQLDARGGLHLARMHDDEPHSSERALRYHPLSVPPVHDPNLRSHDLDQLRARTHEWLRDVLTPALARAHTQPDDAWTFLVQVVDPREIVHYRIRVESGHASFSLDDEPEWDALNVVAASVLLDVIEHRICWADAVLSGALRGFSRGYRVSEHGAQPRELSAAFLYYGYGFEESTRNAVRWQIEHPEFDPPSLRAPRE